MFRSPLEYLKHILDESNFVIKHTKSISKETFINDEVLSKAIVRSIEIIGEATKQVDENFKIKYPQIEWRKMSATRNILIHVYFGIDYDILWDIITTKIPVLQKHVEEILQKEGR
ncbi:MAG: DUF86 domain-containing protein [Flavobacteriales bacterium]